MKKKIDKKGILFWITGLSGSGKTTIAKKILLIKANNPKYILRNYMAQEAIEAAEDSDFLPLETLIEVITSPYNEQEKYEYFANRSPDWANNLEISCSS